VRAAILEPSGKLSVLNYETKRTTTEKESPGSASLK
jgi:uncharacterized membrane protein YcaP (DUF421 family)